MQYKDKIIVGGVVITSLLTSSTIYNYNKLNNIKNENNKLREQIENNIKNKNIKYKDIDTTYSEIIEINKKNTNLIIYEAKAKEYSTTISDNKLIESKVTLNTSYKYTVTIDLSRAELGKVGDRYTIYVDLEDIKLDTITINPSIITYDINWLNQFKGSSQAELTQDIMNKTYADIDRVVHKDYKEQRDIIESRAKDKITSIYRGLDVDIIFTGHIGDNHNE